VITDEQVEDALTYLRDSAKAAAVAKAQARTLEKYLGVVEAQQKAKAAGRSNAAAQDEARASPEYREAITAWEEAVRRDSEFSMLREAAAARIEAWRTMCSNARAERV
jgi:23S rRNA maturation mini-RNase III